MRDISGLMLQERPLQVLPGLACAIGLTEAVVLQQLYWLLSSPRNGRTIAGKQWIFNTYEQWRVDYFPFLSERTIQRTFQWLTEQGYVESCQPEGVISRRKYYRIAEGSVSQLSEDAKLALSSCQSVVIQKVPKGQHPITETSSKTSSIESEEAKETAVPIGTAAPVVLKESDAMWKPDPRSKAQKLKTIVQPASYPSELEFDAFLDSDGLDHLASHRSDIYSKLCNDKFHRWVPHLKKWEVIRDWRAYVRGLDAKIGQQFG